MGPRPVRPDERDWLIARMTEEFGGPVVARDGERIFLEATEGLQLGDGFLTYLVDGTTAEIVALSARPKGQGIGTRLVDAFVALAQGWGVTEVRVTTTNDNVDGLAFYQKRGFALKALRPGAIDQAREIKPEIPSFADNGLPIRDELDLLRKLTP